MFYVDGSLHCVNEFYSSCGSNVLIGTWDCTESGPGREDGVVYSLVKNDMISDILSFRP